MKTDYAVIRFAGDELFVGVTPSGHAIALDSNKEANRAATPMELLLIALGSCAAVDVVEILRKKKLRVTDYRVEVRGERRVEHPRKWTRMTVQHIVRGVGIPEKAVAQAVELSERKYCSVAASLRDGVEILSSFEIIEDAENHKS